MSNREELLDLYLDNELTEDQKIEFNNLLNTDSQFKREVDIMKKIQDESKELPKMKQAESFKLKPKTKKNFSFKHFGYGILTATFAIFIGMNGLDFISQGTTGLKTATDDAYYEETRTSDFGMAVNESAFEDTDGVSPDSVVGDMIEEESDEKFIYNAYMNLEVTMMDEKIASIKSIIKNADAYIQNINNYVNPGYIYYEDDRKFEYPDTEYYYLAIRIPSDNLNDVVASISALGDVTRYNESASNVTEWYTDIESRLELQRSKLKRLNALLEEADNMTDLITLENSISDTIYQIENLESQLKNLDKDIEYSTLTINISEVAEAELTISERNLFQEIADTFIYSLDSFVSTVVAGLKGIIYLLPYALILGVLYAIVQFFRKRK